MPIVEADLWKHPGHPGMIVVTTSGSIDRKGRLVMQGEYAAQAAERIPGIEEQCAQMIRSTTSQGVFGFLPVRPSRPEANLLGFGIFQTRRSTGEPADPELIRIAMDDLRQYVVTNSAMKVRMNYPGIGEEGLPVEEVAPILTAVPPNLYICHNGEVPPSIPFGLDGAKELFLTIERWVIEGRSSFAVEYLMENGYDRQEAADQVAAVRRSLQERQERAAERYRQNQPQRWEQGRMALRD